MARTPRPLPSALALATAAGGLFVIGACSVEAPTPQKVDPAPAVEPAIEAEAEAETKAAPPLTEEELALIATDPKDLTPEMRRKRAYARRKQIMQDPDSPAARALNDLVEAHQAGEIDANGGKGTWFHANGAKPAGGRPPAGWRPSDGTKPGQTQPTPTPSTQTPGQP
ncbi:hypothetical protein [Paraliomyxa miuraensis]|uniref:hypothetical protein n=1 Tax=Paraliomyxa miuraensis TaxID=376150 RepID=UPI00225318BA|nr:hypothetical protein [Paraliomyxa miuraensis]MCX4240002.1 hypothetical protein [Paraliomyxa miuraensis]